MLGSYLCGTINGAYYIGKIRFGEDIRSLGSSTAGARNAGRVFGKAAFVVTVLLDTVKTVVPLLVGFMLSFPNWQLGLLALSVLIGHIWPIQLGGKGGKGVVVYLATALLLVPMSLPVSVISLLIARMLKVGFTNAGLLALVPAPVFLFIYEQWLLAGVFVIMLAIVIIVHKRSAFNE